MAFDPTASAGAGAAQLITYNGPEHTANPSAASRTLMQL
jgi:hypothetical protein